MRLSNATGPAAADAVVEPRGDRFGEPITSSTIPAERGRQTRRLTGPPARTSLAAKNDDLPAGPDELELVDRDVENTIEVWRDVVGLRFTLDLEGMHRALSRAENILDDDGGALALRSMKAAAAPATKSQIGQHCGAMLLAFPGASKLDAAFGRLLVSEVGVVQPRIGPLEAACRKIRRTPRGQYQGALPGVAEVLEAIEKAEERFDKALHAIGRLPSEVPLLRARILEVAEEQRQIEESRRLRVPNY